MAPRRHGTTRPVADASTRSRPHARPRRPARRYPRAAEAPSPGVIYDPLRRLLITVSTHSLNMPILSTVIKIHKHLP